MTKSFATRSIAEGALLAVITAILTSIGTLIPFASMITYLIVAVPIIVLIVRNNLTIGILASVVAAFLIAIFIGPLTATFFYIQFMGIALVYGTMIKKNYAAGKILLAGTIISVISTLILFALVLFVTNISLEDQKQAIYDTVDYSIELYQETGMMENFRKQGLDEEDIRQLLTKTIDLLLKVLPTILIMAGLIAAFTNFIMARLALKRLGIKPPYLAPFAEWRLPWYIIWGVILGWGGYLLGDYMDVNILRVLGQNIMIAYGIILFVLGLAVIAHFMKTYRVGLFTRLGIAFIIIFMFHYAVLLTLGIGMFDLIFDYRKLGEKEEIS